MRTNFTIRLPIPGGIKDPEAKKFCDELVKVMLDLVKDLHYDLERVEMQEKTSDPVLADFDANDQPILGSGTNKGIYFRIGGVLYKATLTAV